MVLVSITGTCSEADVLRTVSPSRHNHNTTICTRSHSSSTPADLSSNLQGFFVAHPSLIRALSSTHHPSPPLPPTSGSPPPQLASVFRRRWNLDVQSTVGSQTRGRDLSRVRLKVSHLSAPRLCPVPSLGLPPTDSRLHAQAADASFVDVVTRAVAGRVAMKMCAWVYDGRTLGREGVLGGCSECVSGKGWCGERGTVGRGGEVAMERPRRRVLSSYLWVLFGGERGGGQC